MGIWALKHPEPGREGARVSGGRSPQVFARAWENDAVPTMLKEKDGRWLTIIFDNAH